MRLRSSYYSTFILTVLGPAFGLGSHAYAQDTSSVDIEHTVFLIGDAGEPSVIGSTHFTELNSQLSQAGTKSSIIFLGDNIYPKGLPSRDDKNRLEAESIIQAQLEIVKNYPGNAFFVPGNHDWEKGQKNGWTQNNRQELFVEDYLDSADVYLPSNGCPGPVEIQVSEHVVIILINTQWLLHPWDKPSKEDGCEVDTRQELYVLLHDALERNADKRVIIASHHPVITYGIHGGVTNLKDHIFPLTEFGNLYIPLPLIGSLYPFYRKFVGSYQDLAHPDYRSYKNQLMSLMEDFPGTVHASGHEHSLQYSFKDSVFYIVSGAGSKHTRVKKKGYARFAEETVGFTRLDFRQDGGVVLSFYNQLGVKIYDDNLYTKPYQKQSEIVSQFEELNLTDTVVITSASQQYLKSPKAGFFWTGRNYREVWAAPVEAPVFDIGKEKGGLKILKKGGGMQTKSLRLEAEDERQYVLRSIEKYTEAVVPEPLRQTVAADLIQDQISASHPYAAFVVRHLADAADIYHTSPKFVYIPDDPRFGKYRSDFANSLVLFEERPAGDWEKKKSFGKSEEIISTADLLKKLYKDNDNQVDQKWVLKTRLFDLFIGDWDRHDDQWRWATIDKKGKGDLFRPIPRDRDQAFFVSQGFIMSIVRKRWAMPKFQGFDHDLKYPAGFMFNARYFDRDFLSEMDREDWEKAADKLAEKMSDEEIDKALSKWPESVYALSGEEVSSKLKTRRGRLKDFALDYYDFLSKVVNVRGSNKKEFFKVQRENDYETRVRMYKRTDDDDTDKLLYDRTFVRGETQEIRLYGLDGDDLFEISGKTKKGIRVRIIGGEGDDEIEDKGKVSGLSRKTLVYDTRRGNRLELSTESRNRTSNNPGVNEYNRNDFKYNLLAPLVLLNYNVDDKLFFGGGFLATAHGFRKDPFKSRHFFLASAAPQTESWNFHYKSTFTDVIRKLDLNVDALAQSPNFTTNFFGIGNETVYDQQASLTYNVDEDIDYYRVRFEHYSLSLSLQRRLGAKATLEVGPHWQGFRTQQDYDGEDRFILDYAVTDDPTIFEFKNYQGLFGKLIYDSRNSKTVPTRGIYWESDLRGFSGLNNVSNRFLRFQSDLSLYFSVRLPNILTLAARAGGGVNRGDYEYYQGQFLGGIQHIRGLRKTRFLGDRKFYSNLEARLQLAQIYNVVLPLSVGINGFYDIGRVWVSGEGSNVWHRGIGGGIWFAPLNATIISLELGSSEEELRFYGRLGFMF